ncbi:NF038132 family protein [Comamonas sp. B-9]|uniref:NF038132 family protein n=1 Tax=unclassified Comamonas TaxID=2638500 RepID=UPI0003FDD90B
MKITTLLATAGLVFSAQSWAIDTTGWTCSNLIGCGTSTADGVVTDAPVAGTTGYAWVSTQQSSGGATPPDFETSNLPTGVPTADVKSGATYTSPTFAVPASNSPVSFQFNYVTSDGGEFSDFAWARLLDSSGNEVALLFTARTDPVASVVPGNGMPPHQATLTPPSVPIIPGAPTWAPLGTVNDGSGGCWDDGCGYSGWVEATYVVANPGAYRLEVGVVNWSDNGYQSGLAVDGLLVAGQPPSSLALTNPGTLPAFTKPVYSGSVANPGTSTTVDLVITGPNGYVENIQATLNPDNTYSTQGAGLPAGQYSVTATLTGTSSTQTQEFTVTAPPPPTAPKTVPTLGGIGLLLLSGLVAGSMGLMRRRKSN